MSAQPSTAHNRAFTLTLRQAQIAKLYLYGKTQAEIATEVASTTQQVSRELAIIHARWLSSALRDYNEAKAKELARLDELERTFLAEYQESKTEDGRTTKVTHQWSDEEKKTGNLRPRASLKKILGPTTGDPRFLQGALDCVRERIKILGLVELPPPAPPPERGIVRIEHVVIDAGDAAREVGPGATATRTLTLPPEAVAVRS